MPKRVDHEQRRQLIADAVCRLTAELGIEAVSLRHVADDAGVSMGLVQHYFRGKDDMLVFAFRALSGRVEQRIRAATAALEEQRGRPLVRVLLAELLAVDGPARAEAPVWVAYLARAVVEPRVAAVLRENIDGMRAYLAGLLREAQEVGEVPAEVDADQEAASLLALVDGLMAHALIGDDLATDPLATLDYRLDRIFTEA